MEQLVVSIASVTFVMVAAQDGWVISRSNRLLVKLYHQQKEAVIMQQQMTKSRYDHVAVAKSWCTSRCVNIVEVNILLPGL